MSVAHLSAEMWQRLRRIPPSERIGSSEMLNLVCCFPLQELGRLALWLLTFLSLPPPDFLYPEADEEDYRDRDRDRDRDRAFAYGSYSAAIASY